MGILSLFTFGNERNNQREVPASNGLVVDLGTFRIGSTLLGAAPSASDPFHAALGKSEVFEPKGQGVEIGTDEGVLDYGFFTLGSFRGSFTRSGNPLTISESTTEDGIRQIFGEPYWVDRSDGDTILFYEYQKGLIELQFEFLEPGNLGFVTLSRNGVLADSDNRESYGVTKPWPPT